MTMSKLCFHYKHWLRILSPFGKKNYFNEIKLRNFGLGSSICNKSNEKSLSEMSSKSLDNIPYRTLDSVRAVSKKRNKLSKVDEKDMELIHNLKKGNLYYPYKDEIEKCKEELKEDIQVSLRKLTFSLTSIETGALEPVYFHRSTDVLIIGAGSVGLSIAYALRNEFPFGPKILVVGKDDSFLPSSLNLGKGIVNSQLFSEEEEISMLKYGLEFFSGFSRYTYVHDRPQFSVNYDPLGSLLLVDINNLESVGNRCQILEKSGLKTRILEKDTLKKKFPWLNTENILFGSLAMANDGMIDPWSYACGLKCKSVNLGVQFATAEVIDFGIVNSVIRRAICRLPDGSYNSIDFSKCIIAGGIESLNLVHILNEIPDFPFKLKLPLEERMRYEYCFYYPEGPGLSTPLTIDTDGTYFRREGLTGHYVTGVPSVISNDDDDEENGPYSVFQKKVKPFLEKRITHFNDAKLVRGWIDAYDFCTSNQVGIIGPHPGIHNIFYALGFSHFGLQYLPALSRALMEYLYYQEYRTIDFEPFHIQNLWRKQHLEAELEKRKLLESQKRIAITE